MAASDVNATARSRWTRADLAFAGGFGLYVLAGLGPLVLGAVAWAALGAGWHDALHEVAFVRGGDVLGRGAASMADAAHTTEPWSGLALDYGFSLFNVVLAGFLLWLRPRDRTARLLAVALVGSATVFNLQAYRVWEALDATALDVGVHAAFHVVAAVAYAMALLLFPDGVLIPRWSRPRQIALYLPLVLAAAAGAVAIQGTSRTLAIILVFGLVTPLVGVAAQVYRYRTAPSGEARQHARTLFWALLPALLLGVYTLGRGVTASAFEVYAGRPLDIIPVALFRVFQPVFAIIPVALFVGIVRFRMWDIDRVITRTLAYGSMAAFVTAVYVGVVVGVGSLVDIAGDNLVLSIVATGVVAVAFEPVKERARHLANRLVYGRRATPYEVLSRFSERAGEALPTEETLAEMARLLAEGTAATRTDVWLAVGSRLRPAASWPPDVAAKPALRLIDGELPDMVDVTAVVPVRHRGELLGALAVTKPRSETLDPTEEVLLGDLAAQAGLLLRNVRLTAELLDRLEELRASRKRLVAAQDEERRRLERDLHDGAQQQLVALKVKLALAARVAEEGKPVAPMLQHLADDTQEAIENLRDLARGIYPPLLAAQGLPSALSAQANKSPLPVIVESSGVERYDQDVEAAVYFCCLEALQNVAKYAQASAIVVTLHAQDGWLTFAVADDGIGFDADHVVRGAGLQNMADRLDALGGSLDVQAAPGEGCTLSGRVPVPAPAPAAAATGPAAAVTVPDA